MEDRNVLLTIVVVSLFSLGCGESPVAPDPEVGDQTAAPLIELLDGVCFVSKEKVEVGHGRFQKFIGFGKHGFSCGYADVFTWGTVVYKEEGRIEGIIQGSQREVSGRYDAATDELLWDGVAYRRELPLDTETIEEGRAADNLRIAPLVDYLAGKHIKIAYDDEANLWLLDAHEFPDVRITFWIQSFPVSASFNQMYQVLGGMEGDYTFNRDARLAISKPACYKDGQLLAETPNGETIPQLKSWFYSYQAADAPRSWSMNNGVRDPENRQINKFVAYFAGNGIDLKDEGHGGWRVADSAGPDGIDYSFHVMTFPEDASEEQMCQTLMGINLAFELNAPARIAISCLGGEQGTLQEKVYMLFRAYRP